MVSVLREVKYLKARQTESIPDTAEQVYTSRGQLWQYIANLELTVRRYNKVVSTVLEVEHPLVQGQLRDIDTHLREAEEDINWNSQGQRSKLQGEVGHYGCPNVSTWAKTVHNFLLTWAWLHYSTVLL